MFSRSDRCIDPCRVRRSKSQLNSLRRCGSFCLLSPLSLTALAHTPTPKIHDNRKQSSHCGNPVKSPNEPSMPWRVRPRSVSSLCPCRLNLDSRQCPGPTPAAPSPPSEHRSGHFKQLPANMFGGSERDIEKSCTCHAQRRRRCRNRNSQRRALAHAWPSRGPPSWNNTLPT